MSEQPWLHGQERPGYEKERLLVKSFELKVLVALFLGIAIGLGLLWWATRSTVESPRSSVMIAGRVAGHRALAVARSPASSPASVVHGQRV